MCVCIPVLVTTLPAVAQQYRTFAEHTRCCASILVVFVVFCVRMFSFAGSIRRRRDTAITDRHSDTTIFQLRAHWVRISWSVGSEKSFGHVPPPMGVKPLTSCVLGEHPIHPMSGQVLLFIIIIIIRFLINVQVQGHIHNSGPASRQLACCTHGRSHTRSPGVLS